MPSSTSPIGDPRRGVYLKWLFFGPSCVEPAITERAYPRKEPPARATLGFGDFDTVVDVLAKGVGAANPYLMGAQFTAADVIIGSGLRWGMMFKLLPERPGVQGLRRPPQRAPRAQAGDGEGRQAGEEQEQEAGPDTPAANSGYSHFLLLPGLAGGVAAVALGLALGGLGGVADHLLDGLALLARLPLDLLLGLALGPLGGFLGPDDRPLLLAHLARGSDGLPLLAALAITSGSSGPGRALNFSSAFCLASAARASRSFMSWSL